MRLLWAIFRRVNVIFSWLHSIWNRITKNKSIEIKWKIFQFQIQRFVSHFKWIVPLLTSPDAIIDINLRHFAWSSIRNSSRILKGESFKLLVSWRYPFDIDYISWKFSFIFHFSLTFSGKWVYTLLLNVSVEHYPFSI